MARSSRSRTTPLLSGLAREDDVKGNILCLCMLYGQEDKTPEKEFGQVWRDRLRLVQLENNGWRVYSCDMAHPEQQGVDGRHLQANFDNSRFQQDFLKRWGPEMKFRQVIFDYFYIPDAWSQQRWGSGTFVLETIPWLKDQCEVKEFWLPNCPVMCSLLEEHEDYLESIGIEWKIVKETWKNPLFVATAQVDSVFKESTMEVKTNENQVEAYLDKDYPFIRISAFKGAKDTHAQTQTHTQKGKENKGKGKKRAAVGDGAVGVGGGGGGGLSVATGAGLGNDGCEGERKGEKKEGGGGEASSARKRGRPRGGVEKENAMQVSPAVSAAASSSSSSSKTSSVASSSFSAQKSTRME